jgi:ABC-type amino acid transport substrate-binding protein
VKNRGQFVILDTPFVRDDNYIGFSLDMHRQNTLAKINRALRKMREEGAIRRIEERY